MKKLLSLMLLAVFLTVVILSTGCGSQKKNVIRYAFGAEPQSMDPRRDMEYQSSLVMFQAFECLTTLSVNGAAEPAAAESWEKSADGQKYIFHLRKNAKWSNGEPVHAADFEYAWKTALAPEFASGGVAMFYFIKNAEDYNNGKKGITADDVGVKALDDYTLEVQTARPVEYLPVLVAAPIFSPVNRKLAASNDKWFNEAASYVGNGPFKLITYERQNKIEFTRNDYYWDKDNVKSNGLIFYIVENPATKLKMFENNQADMMDSPQPSDTERLVKSGVASELPHMATLAYLINVQKPPFDNLKVRQAFSFAMNRALITEKILKAGQKPAMALVSPGMPDVKPGSDFRTTGGDLFKDNDVQTAKKLLAEAGYPEGKGFPPVTLVFGTTDLSKSLAEAAQEMWKNNLNITVKLESMESKALSHKKEKLDYWLASGGWGGDYPDPNTYMEIFQNNTLNTSGYHNNKYDALVNDANNTLDIAARYAKMHAAEKLLMDDMPIIPLYFSSFVLVKKPELQGLKINGLKYMYFKEAYLKQ